MKLKNVTKTIKSIKNPLEFRKYVFYKVISLLFRKNNGTYVLDEEWDNLIILDACRYDFFKRALIKQKLQGKLEFRISRGSHTIPFLIENFKNRKRSDIIYITANPYVDIHLKENFYKIISVWKDGWSDKYHTVLPETMYEYSLKTVNTYPNKKIIIHFMQPHYPYINNNTELNALKYLRESVLENKKNSFNVFNERVLKEKFWALYSYYVYRMFDIDTHIKGYWRNLTLTLPYVKKLINKMTGITVVTADHGEAFGEFVHPLFPIRYYGHRNGVRIPVLVKVPWLIIKKNLSRDDYKRDKIEKRLINNKIDMLKKIGKI